MKKGYEIIAEIEATSSKLEKEAIIRREAEAGNKEFFDGLRLALDPMITFGIKKIPTQTIENPTQGLEWKVFEHTTSLFATRHLTGNNAKASVEGMMHLAQKEEWNGWFRRILLKDLKAGFTEKTVNKAVKGVNASYEIRTFGCQLAQDGVEHPHRICGRKFIDVKLDGVRLLSIVYPDGRVDQFSRNGKEMPNFTKIRDQLSSVAHLFSEPLVLDGEIMGQNFQDLMKQARRKTNVNTDDSVLNLFDIIPLTEFEKGKSKKIQEDRSYDLAKWFEEAAFHCPNVDLVKFEEVDLDTEEGKEFYKQFNANAIAAKLEGIMVKDPQAYYEVKRSYAWLKVKPFISVSLKVVGAKLGKEDGKNANRLGAFFCEGFEDGKFIRVDVGGGYTEEQREDFWNRRDELFGMIMEVEADAITKSEDGDYYSLRFPVFKTFRGFEAGEKM
jgi:DNA ligase-1